MLKNAGVDDDVIEYMIETEFIPEQFTWDYGRAPYDYWYYHYNYAYYPSYDYYNPYSMYSNWGMPYYRSPYTVQRRRGLVGRYYDYYPVTPPPGREHYLRERRPDERRPEEGKSKE